MIPSKLLRVTGHDPNGRSPLTRSAPENQEVTQQTQGDQCNNEHTVLHKLCEVLVAFDCFLMPPKVRFRLDRNLVYC